MSLRYICRNLRFYDYSKASLSYHSKTNDVLAFLQHNFAKMLSQVSFKWDIVACTHMSGSKASSIHDSIFTLLAYCCCVWDPHFKKHVEDLTFSNIYLWNYFQQLITLCSFLFIKNYLDQFYFYNIYYISSVATVTSPTLIIFI